MAIPLAINGPQTPPPAPRGVQWIDVATAAKRLGLDERSVRRLCGKTWAPAGLAKVERPAEAGLKPQWLIREDADGRLGRCRGPEDMPADLTRLTDAHRRRVLCKRDIVKAWDAFQRSGDMCGRRQEQVYDYFIALLASGRVDGVRVPAFMELPSLRTLRNWKDLWEFGGLEGLVDGRKTRQQKPTGEDPFFEAFKRYYLTQDGRSIKLCQELAKVDAAREGFFVRSYPQTKRFVSSLPRSVVNKHRGGDEEYNNRSGAYIQRDYSGLRSNDIWCADHHQFDVWVTHEGKLIRPWLTAFQDVRSRKIVGWHVSADGGNVDTILVALQAGIRTDGAPLELYVDNGKDFDAAAIQGITKRQRRAGATADEAAMKGVCGELGITVTHTWPYHGQSKPIERFFGTLEDRFGKLQPTYCGNGPANRPEHLQAKLDRGAAPLLADFAEAFRLWLAGDYHARGHTGDGMDGRTPADVFDACLERKRTVPDAILEVMLWRGHLAKVGRNGVRSGGLLYGVREDALIKWEGKSVLIQTDPADKSRAIIRTPEGALICMAASNERLPFRAGQEQSRKAIAAVKARKKQAAEFHRQRPKRHNDVAAAMWDQAAEESAPPLSPIRTPMDDQLPALERALNDGVRAPSAGKSIDLYGADAPVDGPPPVTLFTMRDLMRKREEEMEQARLAEEQADPFFKLGRILSEQREAVGE